MGRKVHPIGFRLGTIRDWQAHWFASKKENFREMLLEDVKFRASIWKKYHDAGIARIQIERGAHEVVVTTHTARPGIVTGGGGQGVVEVRRDLQPARK